jgi:hypothetical protein
MDFKFNGKNTIGIGILSTIILIVLLFQSAFFNLLTETVLGRILMLAFVILIAFANQFLGLFAVLAIIIAFNQHDMNVVQSYSNVVYEGFVEGAKFKHVSPKTAPKPTATDAKVKAAAKATAKATAKEPAGYLSNTIKQYIDRKIINAVAKATALTATTAKAAAPKAATKATPAKATTKAAPPKSNKKSNKKEKFSSNEGFCMLDKESCILKGKQSNSIKIFNPYRGQSDDVSPYDDSSFSTNCGQI